MSWLQAGAWGAWVRNQRPCAGPEVAMWFTAIAFGLGVTEMGRLSVATHFEDPRTIPSD